MDMVTVFRAASAVALIASLFWCYSRPGYDSGVAVLAAVSVLASSFIKRKETIALSQTQNVSGKSIAIQAGRDANSNSIEDSKP